MKLIILDRDGVINQDSIHYIKSPDELIFIPGSCEAIARLTKVGFTVAVATNQSGIARGYYDEAQLEAIHAKMQAGVTAVGGCISLIRHCPHMPEAGCACRKPQPGMLQAISKQFDCDLKNVFFIGDRVSDIQAAEAAGAIPIMVMSPMTDRVGLAEYPHVPVYTSLAHCVDDLIALK